MAHDEQHNNPHHQNRPLMASITPSLLFEEEEQEDGAHMEVDIRILVHDDHDMLAQRSAHAALIQSLQEMDPPEGPQCIRSVFMEALRQIQIQTSSPQDILHAHDGSGGQERDTGEEQEEKKKNQQQQRQSHTRLVMILRCPWAHKEDIASFIAEYVQRGSYDSVLILSELSDYVYEWIHKTDRTETTADPESKQSSHTHNNGHRTVSHDQETEETSLPLLHYLRLVVQRYLEDDLGQTSTSGSGANLPSISARFVVLPQSCVACLCNSGATNEDVEGISRTHWPQEVSVFSTVPPRFLTCMFVEDIWKRNRPAFSGKRDRESAKTLYDVDPLHIPTRSIQEMRLIGHMLLGETRRRNLDISTTGACFGMGRLSTWIGNWIMQQAVEDPDFDNHTSSNQHQEPAALILLDRALDFVGPLLLPSRRSRSSNKGVNPIAIQNVSSNLLSRVWSYWEYAEQRRCAWGHHATTDTSTSTQTTPWLPMAREEASEDSMGVLPVDAAVLDAWDAQYYEELPCTNGELPVKTARHILFHLFRVYWRYGPSLFSAQDQLNSHFRYLIYFSGLDKAYDYLIQYMVEYLDVHDEASDMSVNIEKDDKWRITLRNEGDTHEESLTLDSIIRVVCSKKDQRNVKLEQLARLWFILIRRPSPSRIGHANVISNIQAILISQMKIPIWDYLTYPTQREDIHHCISDVEYDLSTVLPFLMQTKDQLHHRDGGFLLDPWMVILDLVLQYTDSRWEDLAGSTSSNKSEMKHLPFGTVVHAMLLVASMHGESVALVDQEHLNVEQKTVQGHVFFVALKCLSTAMLMAKEAEADKWFPKSRYHLTQLRALPSIVDSLEQIIKKCKMIKDCLSSDSFSNLTPEFFDSSSSLEDTSDENWEESWSQWSEEESGEQDGQVDNDDDDSTLQKVHLIQKGLENNVVRKWLRKTTEVSHMRNSMRDFAVEDTNSEASREESPLTDFSCFSGLRFSINSLQEAYSSYLARLVDLVINSNLDEIPELLQLGSKAQHLSRKTAQAAYATIGAAESFVKRGVGALSSTFGESFKSSLHGTAGKFFGSTVGSVKQHMTSWKSHPAKFNTIVFFITGGLSGVDVSSLEALRMNAEKKYFGSGKRIIIMSTHICSDVSILHDFTCA